jgi:hypothetical protein
MEYREIEIEYGGMDDPQQNRALPECIIPFSSLRGVGPTGRRQENGTL